VNEGSPARWVLTSRTNLFVITYGVSRFADLTEIKVPIGPDDLHDDFFFMVYAGAITLLAELAISSTEGGEHIVRHSVVPRATGLGG
jgi:hypothetical protein